MIHGRSYAKAPTRKIGRVLVALAPIERVPRQDRLAGRLHDLLVMQQVGVAELRAQGKALAPVGHAHDVPRQQIAGARMFDARAVRALVPVNAIQDISFYGRAAGSYARREFFLHEYNSWRLCSKALLASFRRIHQVQSWRIRFKSNSKVQNGRNGMGHMRSALAYKYGVKPKP